MVDEREKKEKNKRKNLISSNFDAVGECFEEKNKRCGQYEVNRE